MPKEEHERKILYLKVDTVNDLCRYACNFDFTSSNLILTKDKKLVALGEGLGETLLAYYTTTSEKGRFIKYTPGSSDGPETVRFVNTTEQEQVNSNYISVISVDLNAFKKADKMDKKAVTVVEVGDIDDIISMTLKKAMKTESILYVYSFEYKGKPVIGTFELIEELTDDSKTFYYAYLNEKPKAGFARYNYADSKLDFTNNIGEHSYMYVKIINLSEPFPFFKD